MSTFQAEPRNMKLLSALVRDPNMIHLEGDRPVNQGPIVMSWLLQTARQDGGAVTAFRVRFVSEIRGGDVVTCTVSERRPTPQGHDLTLVATVGDRIAATAEASVAS